MVELRFDDQVRVQQRFEGFERIGPDHGRKIGHSGERPVVLAIVPFGNEGRTGGPVGFGPEKRQRPSVRPNGGAGVERSRAARS